MIAHLDTKGRVVIPAGMREELKLSPGDAVDLSTDSSGQALIMLPIPPRCAICGTQSSMLAEYGDDPVRSICSACAFEITSATLVFSPNK